MADDSIVITSIARGDDATRWAIIRTLLDLEAVDLMIEPEPGSLIADHVRAACAPNVSSSEDFARQLVAMCEETSMVRAESEALRHINARLRELPSGREAAPCHGR